MQDAPCPLCGNSEHPTSLNSNKREFLLCTECALVYSPADQLPQSGPERQRYESHHNSIEDKGYVDFLNRALEPARKLLSPTARILDYGCGPNPVLCNILSGEGFSCSSYDPFFFPGEPQGKFDCIFSTETFEHFHHPAREMERLSQLLHQNGLLVVMTEFYRDLDHFRNWWYTRDFTHVVFYNEDVFRFICHRFGFKLIYIDGERVVVLQKSKD